MTSMGRGTSIALGALYSVLWPCHPDIVNAVVEQTKLLQHTTTIYMHNAIVKFAEALTSKMPDNLKVKYTAIGGILIYAYVLSTSHFSWCHRLCILSILGLQQMNWQRWLECTLVISE
jgi:hypothetical protein